MRFTKPGQGVVRATTHAITGSGTITLQTQINKPGLTVDFSRNKIKRDYLQLFEHYVVAYYKRVSGRPASTVFDIHEEAWEVMQHMEWKEIIRPFVIDDIKSKHHNGRMALARKYEVTPHCILTIGQEIGYWK